MTRAAYDSLNFPTPESLRGKYDGCKALIMGTGDSTKKILKYKSEIKKHFDVVIGLSFSIKDFEDIMDFHMSQEIEPKRLIKEMISSGYRKDLLRVLGYKSINFFPKDLNIIKSKRALFSDDVMDITKYNINNDEGLVWHVDKLKSGKVDAVGTVTLQALHFACILGCKSIHLIGADMVFKGEYDHYYGDKVYRDDRVYREPATAPHKIVIVDLVGKKYQTTHIFEKSAKYINKMIVEQCNPREIKVYDFSEGLINQAISKDVDMFFKDNG